MEIFRLKCIYFKVKSVYYCCSYLSIHTESWIRFCKMVQQKKYCSLLPREHSFVDWTCNRALISISCIQNSTVLYSTLHSTILLARQENQKNNLSFLQRLSFNRRIQGIFTVVIQTKFSKRKKKLSPNHCYQRLRMSPDLLCPVQSPSTYPVLCRRFIISS